MDAIEDKLIFNNENEGRETIMLIDMDLPLWAVSVDTDFQEPRKAWSGLVSYSNVCMTLSVAEENIYTSWNDCKLLIQDMSLSFFVFILIPLLCFMLKVCWVRQDVKTDGTSYVWLFCLTNCLKYKELCSQEYLKQERNHTGNGCDMKYPLPYILWW